MLPKIQAQTIQQDRVSTLPFSPKNGHNISQQRLAQQNQSAMNNTNGNNMNNTQNFNSNPFMNQNNSMDDFLKRKESNWDQRHHVKADLPSYNAYEDRHSESYKLSLAIHTSNGRKRKPFGYKQQYMMPNEGNVQQSHDLNQSAIYQDEMGNSSTNFKKKHFSQSQQRNRSLTYKRIKDQKFQSNNGNISTTNQQNQILNVAYNQFGMESLTDAQQLQRDGNKNKRILTLKEKVEELYQQIVGLYEFHNFQHFHREYFDLFIQDMPSKRLYDILIREIKLINEKKSLYQISMKTIRARENCLDKLKDAIFSLSDSYEKRDQQIEESCFDNCCRLLAHLRILTISAVEAISQWRNYFFFIQKYAMGYEKYKKKDIMLIFFWEHMNYMLKIRSDAHFINHSVMNRYIPFSTKYDPFFVYPNKIKGDSAQFSQFSNKIQESINGCLDLSDHLKHRIQNCEKIIISECIMDRANKKLHPISKELLLVQTPKYLKPKGLTVDQNGSMGGQYIPNLVASDRHVSHEPRGQYDQEVIMPGSASLRVERSANALRSNSRVGLQSSRKSMSANKKSNPNDKYLIYSSNKNGLSGYSNNPSDNKQHQSHKNFNNQSLSLSDIKQNQGLELDNSDQYNDQSFNQTFSPKKVQEKQQLQNRQPSNFNLDQITPNDVNLTPGNVQDQQYYSNNVPYIQQMTNSPSKSQATYTQSPNQKQYTNQQNSIPMLEENGVLNSQQSSNNMMVYVNSREPNNQLKLAGATNQTSAQQKRAASGTNAGLNNNNQSLKQMAQNQKSKLKGQVTSAGQNGQKGAPYNKNPQGGRRTASGNQNDMVKMNVQDIGIAISEYIENKLKEPREKVYYVKPRSIMERELKVTLKDYFLRIPNILYKLLVSDENGLINKLKDETNFHLLEIREQQTERIAALSIIHVDRSVITCRRLEIDHFSVIELENFDPILKKLLEYIWNHDSADEISFRICCNEQPEELNPFQSVQEILFENHFKWREVETNNEDNDNYFNEGINPMDLNNSQGYQKAGPNNTTIKIFYVQRPNSKPKVKLPNLKYVENHVLTVKQSVIISKEPLEMEDHMKMMNLQYLEKPAKYVDVTMILISILVQIFTAENLKDLAAVKTNKKVKETFNIASQLRAPTTNANGNNVRESIQTSQAVINENDAESIQNGHEKSEMSLKKQSQSQIKDNQQQSNNQNNFLLKSGILKTEEFPQIQGLNKYLVGLNQNVFLLKDPPVFKKNKVNLGFLQHGFHLPNFHQSALTTVGDKPSYYLRIRVTEDLQGLCWKLKSSSVYGDQQLLLIPTEDFNNFMFFLDAREYLAKDNPPDLFLFLRKFLESVDEKQQMEGDMWIPQFKKKSLLIKNTDVASIFAEKKIYTNLETSLVFRDQIQGGKMILNDLEQNAFLIKAPFIFGMLHNDLDAIIQNVPFYSFIVDEDDLDFVQDKNSYHRRINTNIHPTLLQNNPTNGQLKKMNTQETLK